MAANQNDPISVKIVKIGAPTQELGVGRGETVANVLRQAGVETTGYQVRLDGEPVELNDEIMEDFVILTLVPQVKGGGH